MQQSRRSFLTGRRSALSPWEQFCRRLYRAVEGDFLDFGQYEDRGSGRLIPAQASDVRRAHALCQEHGVVLALSGINQGSNLLKHNVLWVEPGAALAGCQTLPDNDKNWFVQPGALVSDLAEAGLTQFVGQPGYLTIATWLADRGICNWRPGEASRSGLLHASVLMADGSTAVLGPFGVSNHLPLGTLTLQKMVPALFALAGSETARHFQTLSYWPARYRLEALMAGNEHDINLSHLLLGHGGDLAWVEWLVFEAQPALEPQDWTTSYSSQPFDTDGKIHELAYALDCDVKKLFDPQGVFPNPGQDL